MGRGAWGTVKKNGEEREIKKKRKMKRKR